MVGMKAFTFFMVCFIGGTFLSGIMEGQMAFATTELTAELSVDGITAEVISTQDFLDSDTIHIESEIVAYTSKTTTQFNISQRGLDNTGAVIHEVDAKVKNDTTNLINNMLGYNVAITTGTFGTYVAPVAYAWAFIGAIPKMIAWDYSYLEGRWVMLKYFVLYPISIGFVVSLGLIFISLATGLFRR